MRGPKPLAAVLAETERAALNQFVRRHTTAQQLALRARIVLAAADGRTNTQIARDGAAVARPLGRAAADPSRRPHQHRGASRQKAPSRPFPPFPQRGGASAP